MAESNSIFMPSGSGGLIRYNEEYRSKFKLSPSLVVLLIIATIIGVTFLKIIF